jgi:predicted ribosome quality control (RQC) complex YloA/Tae2 family protein
MEIQLSNLALKHLVEELAVLQNGFVNNVQSLENGWMKIKIHTKELGDKQLIVTPSALFISNYSLPARQNPGGFSALLKKYLDNKRILSIKQNSLDRIIIFEFMEVFLIFELFAKGNIILANKEMQIIKAMRREEWKDRKLEQNEAYKFPSSKGSDPTKETQLEFEKKIKINPKTFFGACVDTLNVSPQILEFAFDNLKLDKKKDANSTSSQEVKKIFEEMKRVYSAKEGTVYLSEGVIYSTQTNKEKEKEFDSVQAALNALLLSDNEKKEITVKETPEKEDLKKKQKYEKEVLARKNQMTGLAVQEKEAQAKGEAVFVHYQEINEVLLAIEKARQKGISEKEIIEKINSVKPIIKELDFKKNKLILNL